VARISSRFHCGRENGVVGPLAAGGGPFEVGNQVLISSHRRRLSSKAMVVSVAETAGQDPVRQG
jgi:hypothetical protein